MHWRYSITRFIGSHTNNDKTDIANIQLKDVNGKIYFELADGLSLMLLIFKLLLFNLRRIRAKDTSNVKDTVSVRDIGVFASLKLVENLKLTSDLVSCLWLVVYMLLLLILSVCVCARVCICICCVNFYLLSTSP